MQKFNFHIVKPRRTYKLTAIIFHYSGESFKIYILAGDTYFHIAINDKPYCTYEYRCSLTAIRALQITRDIQSIVQVDHRSIYPILFPAIQRDDDKIQFSNDIPNTIVPGKLNIKCENKKKKILNVQLTHWFD